MDLSKSVLMSKTYWGLACTVLGTLLPAFGVDISSADLTTFGSHVGAVVQDVLVYGGIAWAAYGRWKANKDLHILPPVAQ